VLRDFVAINVSVRDHEVQPDYDFLPPSRRRAMALESFEGLGSVLSVPLSEEHARWFRGDGIESADQTWTENRAAELAIGASFRRIRSFIEQKRR
jgi:hypothetical protein